MDYREAYEKLKVRGQEHLLRMYDSLTEDERTALLAQIEALDFSPLDHFAEKDEARGEERISPLAAMQIPEIREKRQHFYEKGMAGVREGNLAAVLLAGGMGTRLGTDGPKGAFNIGVTRPVYIFERLIGNLLGRAREAGRMIRLFIMTSEKNDAATRQFLAEHDYFGYDPAWIHFFVQDMAPAVDEDGRVLLETPSRIAVSPNGNGGWFVSLIRAGYGDILKKDGVTWLNVFAVDNVLQQICDPVFFGAVLESGAACGSKVVRKTSPGEKVGVMCLKDGKPSVVEYYEMTDEMRELCDGTGERVYNYGVILNYLFRVPDLLRVMDESMPLHFAHKKIPYLAEDGTTVTPASENGWKFEYFILDLISEMETCLPFEVERSREFAPVKNASGPDSVDTARALLRENGVEL